MSKAETGDDYTHVRSAEPNESDVIRTLDPAENPVQFVSVDYEVQMGTATIAKASTSSPSSARRASAWGNQEQGDEIVDKIESRVWSQFPKTDE